MCSINLSTPFHIYTNTHWIIHTISLVKKFAGLKTENGYVCTLERSAWSFCSRKAHALSGSCCSLAARQANWSLKLLLILVVFSISMGAKSCQVIFFYVFCYVMLCKISTHDERLMHEQDAHHAVTGLINLVEFAQKVSLRKVNFCM